MNMNDKTFIFSPDVPSGFFSGKIFFPEFSAEKIFQNFFSNFFFPEFSAEKIFHNFFSPDFFSGIFYPHHSAEPKN